MDAKGTGKVPFSISMYILIKRKVGVKLNMTENAFDRDSGNSSAKAQLFDYFEAIVFAVAVVIVIFAFVIRTVTVEGPSMEPTLQNGDRLFITNLFYTPKKGDIVVVAVPGVFNDPIVKRVIATEGQTIDINFDKGEVYIDGTLIEEEYIKDITRREEGTEFPLTVGKGEIFVMGDNRNNSEDSRNIRVGSIPVSNVLGRVVFRFYPFDNFGKLD